MNVFEKRLVSVVLLLSLTAGGAIFAQEDDRDASADPAAPPVVVVPLVPQVKDGLSRDGSTRDWRGEVAADREAKGWGSDRPRSQRESRQNWIREYQRRDYYSGGQEQWDRFRDPQDRSDRIGQNRSSFTPVRPDARSDAETQAQAYAALYWMMKAQAEQEQAQDRR
jgi:hypothetical protein